MNAIENFSNRSDVIIFRETGAGRMYLCFDGSLSGSRNDALHAYPGQVDYLIEQNPIVRLGGAVGIEVVNKRGSL